MEPDSQPAKIAIDKDAFLLRCVDEAPQWGSSDIEVWRAFAFSPVGRKLLGSLVMLEKSLTHDSLRIDASAPNVGTMLAKHQGTIHGVRLAVDQLLDFTQPVMENVNEDA